MNGFVAVLTIDGATQPTFGDAIFPTRERAAEVALGGLDLVTFGAPDYDRAKFHVHVIPVTLDTTTEVTE